MEDTEDTAPRGPDERRQPRRPDKVTMLWLVVAVAILTPALCQPPAASSRSPSTPRHGHEDPEAAHWLCPRIDADVAWEAAEATSAEAVQDGVQDADDAEAKRHSVTCSCDLPHTLRCTGGPDTLQEVAARLRALPPRYVSLLDATLAGVSVLGPLLDGVALHGLVVSGELKTVLPDAFARLRQDGAEPRLQALGLPGNLLDAVPAAALAALADLDRLDLSHNRLRSLPPDAFPGLRNLTFLDLSDNQLSDIAAGAFRSLESLQTLRLTGNRLRVAPLSLSLLDGLDGLRALRELDLSSNQLAGPLGPAALPRLGNLRSLNLAHNQLSSVRRGALAGLPQLASLALAHNMVDVLEDHAFRQLGSLASLDLAHNRIVAVSGASLAHLGRLRSLALQHNFLRALTADLVRPLAALQALHLDDNDISQVSEDALAALTAAAPRLSRLTLAENPLNCDCALSPFARWLQRNATKLPASDKASAVCAAPPHLENGLAVDAAEALCQDDPAKVEAVAEEDAALRPGPGAAAVLRSQTQADARVSLRAFEFDGARVSLLWHVNTTAAPYVCDSLFVYEEHVPVGGGGHEVLVESTPLACDSSQLLDPRTLLLTVAVVGAASQGPRLAPGRRYRFCLVLLEGGGEHDDLALVVGCSDVLPLVKTAGAAVSALAPSVVTVGTASSASSTAPRISGLSANLTASGGLAVWVQMAQTSPTPCRVSVSVFAGGVLAAQERLNCSLPGAIINGVGPGPLQVCATAGEASSSSRTRCTSVTATPARRDGRAMSSTATSGAAAAGLAASLAGAALLGVATVVLLLALWRRLRRGRVGAPLGMDHDTGQLYLPPRAPDHDQHARYVKLQATTKL